MRRSPTKPAKREVTDADVWAAEANEKVAAQMAAWLKGSVNLARPIASLTRDEMTRLASVAVGTWIALASQRKGETIGIEKEKLHVLLA
jgi:hypothetical protein